MTTRVRSPQPMYARHAAAADRGSWSVERDVRWDDVDPELARARPAVLDALRDAALIESFHPVHLSELMSATLDDVDAGVIFSLELYEGFKHFHSLRRYLDLVDHSPAITDVALAEVRLATLTETPRAFDLIERLVGFMLSEHLASYFFRRLAEQAIEPVLIDLLMRIAADEVRHAQSASDLITKRIEADASVTARVLAAAAHFHHFGERVVTDVPVAMPGDPLAIRTFARRIERLCGERLVDHLKRAL